MIDPGIIAGLHTTPPPVNPLGDLQTIMQIKQAQQEAPLRIQALQQRAQESALTIQDTQRTLAQKQAMDTAYASSVGVDANGRATIDPDKLTNALAQGGHGSAIPAVLKANAEYQKGMADLQEAQGKVDDIHTKNAAAIGSGVLAVPDQAANLLRVKIQTGVLNKAIDPANAQQVIQKLDAAKQADQQAIASGQPGGQENAVALQFAKSMAASSPEMVTSQARAQTAATSADTAAANKPRIAAETANLQGQVADRAYQQTVGQLAGNPPPTMEALEQFYRANNVSDEVRTRVNAALPQGPYDPMKVGAALNQSAMTADQRATTSQSAANAARATAAQQETARHNAVEETQGAGRLGVEQQRLAQTSGGVQLSASQQAIADKLASGDFNPAQLSRFPDKEALVAGAIAKNPNWSPQTYATKRAFEDPQAKQSQNLGTISRIVGHIGRYEQNSKDMGFAPAFSLGMNLTGDQAKLNEDAHAISGELEKLVSGGVGTEGQVQGWMKGLRAPTAAARQQAVDEISQLIGSQYEGMSQTYKTTTGQDLPAEKYVSPAGRAWMKEKGINVGGATAQGARSGAQGGYIVGRKYGSLTYNGGDPNNKASWK